MFAVELNRAVTTGVVGNRITTLITYLSSCPRGLSAHKCMFLAGRLSVPTTVSLVHRATLWKFNNCSQKVWRLWLPSGPCIRSPYPPAKPLMQQIGNPLPVAQDSSKTVASAVMSFSTAHRSIVSHKELKPGLQHWTAHGCHRKYFVSVLQISLLEDANRSIYVKS